MKRKRTAKKSELTDYEWISDHLYAVARRIAASEDPLKLYLEADSLYNHAIDECVQEAVLRMSHDNAKI